MQETHAQLAELDSVVMWYLPAGTQIDISRLVDQPGWLTTYQTPAPVMLMRQAPQQPIHYGGCI
jgi:hypothetical protein